MRCHWTASRSAPSSLLGAGLEASGVCECAESGRTSRKSQFLADAEPRALFDHGMGERDVGKRQAAVPEDNRFVVALPAGPQAGHDLAHLGMQGLLRQLAGVDMGPQAAEWTALALAPVVDDELLGDVGERQLDGAHRAVGNDEG